MQSRKWLSEPHREWQRWVREHRHRHCRYRSTDGMNWPTWHRTRERRWKARRIAN